MLIHDIWASAWRHANHHAGRILKLDRSTTRINRWCMNSEGITSEYRIHLHYAWQCSPRLQCQGTKSTKVNELLANIHRPSGGTSFKYVASNVNA